MTIEEKGEISLLLVEDNPVDARLLRETLSDMQADEFEITHVSTISDAIQTLQAREFEVLLLDLVLPDSQGLETVTRVLGYGSEAAIVVLTGNADEELAVEAVRQGAQDYLFKGTEGGVLVRAIHHAMERKRLEIEREQLIQELQAALATVKRLSGLLPICASCKKIRDDRGYWTQVEQYIQEHSEVDFNHGICPECAKKLYSEFLEKEENEEDEEAEDECK